METAATPLVRHHDVLILGGGLAGLTLALQLKQRMPELDVLVLERRKHPLPAATHKVGESSVEIQAHYLSSVLGLKDYLDRHQLKKFGFRFFFSDAATDITQVTELGASTFLPTQSYQLDRGILENDLAGKVEALGVHHRDGALVRDFTLGSKGVRHRVRYEHEVWRMTSAATGWSMRAAAPAWSNASWTWRSPTTTRPTPSGSASTAGSTCTTGPTMPTGWRAATRRTAGCRPTTWWARATGSG